MEYRTGVRGLEGRRKRGEGWEEGRVGRGEKERGGAEAGEGQGSGAHSGKERKGRG